MWLVDIETDGLDATVIWCLCAINVKTGEEVTLLDLEAIKHWITERLAEGCWFIGHNFLSFDAPTINRLAGTRIPTGRVVDTFVMSMHYSPSLAGGHSLEAWGVRLGFPKTSFNDWSKLSDEMVAYCLNDCRVNVRLFVRLSDRMRGVGFTERSIELEHKAWSIIRRQRLNGFQLDVPRAHELYAELRQLERELKDEIHEQWPPQLIVVRSFAKSHKADGTPTANYARHVEQYPELRATESGGYEALDYVEFNLGSPKQRIEKLLELGWKPTEFTEKGSPQATRKGNLVPSLERFLIETPNEAVRKLAEWIAINARANNIGTWIELADEKGLLHGNLWLAGTLRYRHDKPNTANIPAVRVGDDKKPLLGRSGVYTYEARDLWVTRDRERRRLVGVDAKGIQLRILAEYIKDESFTSAILSEDPHAANQARMGLPSRSLTKTITYATLMGAGDAKIADTAKVRISEAKAAKALFMQQIPGLPKLIRRLQSELSRTGRITLCDGSRILVPSDHMVIPYLLQGDESRLMKQAMILVDEIVRKEKLDALKVGDIHDEWQTDVLNAHVESFIESCGRAFPEAGRSFGYRVPIECDAKVGLTWAETH
jgi:DNA polymerase-1